MSKKNLPMLPALPPLAGLRSELPPATLERWNELLVMASADEDNTISMLDPIGAGFWSGDGVTAKRIAAALRTIGARDVVVNLNSPGGDFFEGIAIYNLLREHPHNVTVRVIGVAASAASIIAMAGDTVQIAKAGSLMIHNTMMAAFGNKAVFREAADLMDKFDGVLADLYVERTGLERRDVVAMLDAETWMTGEEAMVDGFADALLPADQVKEKNAGASSNAALRRVDAALTKSGMPRSERRALLKSLTGTPSAAEPTPSAGDEAEAIEVVRRMSADFIARAASLSNETLLKNS